MLFHESVDSSLLGNFEFAQFLAEVESFVDSFLEGYQFLLKLKFFKPVFGFNLQVLVWVG